MEHDVTDRSNSRFLTENDSEENIAVTTTREDSTVTGTAAKISRSSKTTPLKRERIEALMKSPTTRTFHAFWISFEPYVRSLCHGRGLYPQETDDVLALVKKAVVEQIGCRGEGKFHAWLGRIARNKAIDVLRTRKNRQESLDDTEVDEVALRLAPGSTTKKAGPATRYMKKEEHEIAESVLEKVVARVSPRQWQIFECSVLRGWDTKTVCKTLGITDQQVYNARCRVGHVYDQELKAIGWKLGCDPTPYQEAMAERDKRGHALTPYQAAVAERARQAKIQCAKPSEN